MDGHNPNSRYHSLIHVSEGVCISLCWVYFTSTYFSVSHDGSRGDGQAGRRAALLVPLGFGAQGHIGGGNEEETSDDGFLM